jgi:hypothetical protein
MFSRRGQRWRCFLAFGKVRCTAMTLREKPQTLLRRFARILGWSPLRQYNHLANDDPTAKKPYLITWYESGQAIGARSDIFLQINESPCGQTKFYRAAVCAIRYRICTPWCEFTLFRSEVRFVAEVERLREWLQRDWFEAPKRRKQYRVLHPECVGAVCLPPCSVLRRK